MPGRSSKVDERNGENHNHDDVYEDDVPCDPAFTDQGSTGLIAQLLTWKCSVYKLVWLDTVLFAVAYATLSLVYRFALCPYPALKQGFEILCVYCNRFGGLIPVAFLCGFYVSQVVARWWDLYLSLPWPEKVAFKMIAFIPGKDSFNTTMRCTIMRYFNLSNLLSYRMVSTKIRDRFPTYQSLVNEGFLLQHEVNVLKRENRLVAPYEATSIPIAWSIKLIQCAMAQNKIAMKSPCYAILISSMDYVQDSHRKLLNYGAMRFPLAYTQVAKWAVGIYFLAALFGRQYLVPSAEGTDAGMFPNVSIPYSSTEPFSNFTPDLFVPIFTFVELLCYMGWIKVADTILNPYGDADEDFQINQLIDRNMRVSYQLVNATNENFEMTDPFFLEAITDGDVSSDLPSKKWKLSGKWDKVFLSDP